MTILNSKEATIDTTTTELKLGEILISADRRSTKEKPLTDAERIRRVILPADQWGELTASNNGASSQGLTDLLRNALRDLGNARLKDILAENPLQRTVALTDFTVGSLLSWNSDTASSRGSITFTREQVEEWYPTSAIYRAMKNRSNAHADFVGKRLAALAAKNHGLKEPADADKLTVLLADDGNTALGAELIQRLGHISKSLTARTAQETISMDDL